ncbi:MAG: GNAT family N-acetyltransferase [Proteobacteria bacterium]|nr:GNAT family N-acetyltransferase [Pseudomonadota bacterium]
MSTQAQGTTPAEDAALPGLRRRVEEASLNAWPAMHQVLLDGWILRMTGGFTKRANSVTPIYPGLTNYAEKVRYCENLYAREQLTTIFRLTSISEQQDLDGFLDQRGYRQDETSLVLTAPIPPREMTPDMHLLTVNDWLHVYSELTGLPEKARHLHQVILNAIRGDCAFAVLQIHGQPLACGLSVADQELIGLFDVVTHVEHRRAGHARSLVSSLLERGRRDGRSRAYLQVLAHNQPALALYHELGFSELYRYWYRLSR